MSQSRLVTFQGGSGQGAMSPADLLPQDSCHLSKTTAGMHTHTCTHIQMHTCISTPTHTWIHVHTHTHMHMIPPKRYDARSRTHKHTDTRAQACHVCTLTQTHAHDLLTAFRTSCSQRQEVLSKLMLLGKRTQDRWNRAGSALPGDPGASFLSPAESPPDKSHRKGGQ
jgi:hypothetical protein